MKYLTLKEPPHKKWYGSVYGEKPKETFYESAEWKRLRRACFYRDNYHCIRCDKRFKSDDLTAHHIVPRKEGGPDTLENLVTLCEVCHDLVEVVGYRDRASIIGSYQEGSLPENFREEKEEPDPYNRPEWHKDVYGGVRRSRR
jgi:hypothetical protein